MSNGASPSSPGPGDPLFDQAGVTAEQLNQLLALLSATDITELEVTVAATRLSLRRQPAPAGAPALPETEREPATLAIASPLVGIFHPSVTVGELVTPGQSIGAIEALGMPTTVDAPHGGTIEDVLVAANSPVEYGQPLLILRRDVAS